jgi:hypothetical protein
MANLISRSEIATFNACERKHYYAYRERLAPEKSQSPAMARGIIGHAALESYYRAKKAGKSRRQCTDAALEVIDEELAIYANDGKMRPILVHLKSVIEAYISYYWDEKWTILEIEKQYDGDLDGILYGMRVDLLVQDERGDIVLVDHKFLYDFFRETPLKFNPQLALYMHNLRAQGIPVKRAVLNQIRYRNLSDWESQPSKVFLRMDYPVSDVRIRNMVKEFSIHANDIRFLENMPLDVHFMVSSMVLDDKVCGYCPYNPLCNDVLEGRDPTDTKRVLYGYNEYLRKYKDDPDPENGQVPDGESSTTGGFKEILYKSANLW